MNTQTIAIRTKASQYRIERNGAIVAFINLRDAGPRAGWWINPMSQGRPSRKAHTTAQAAAKAYGLKIDAWQEQA